MENENKPKYVSTDIDLWNSGDESYFFVVKGKAKPLPEFPTKMIDYALDSGLLRPATQLEIDDYLQETEINQLISDRKIEIGRTQEDTLSNYKAYKSSIVKKNDSKTISKESIKQEVKQEVKEPVKEEPKTNTFEKKTDSKPNRPTQNAINQKPSVSTNSF